VSVCVCVCVLNLKDVRINAGVWIYNNIVSLKKSNYTHTNTIHTNIYIGLGSVRICHF